MEIRQQEIANLKKEENINLLLHKAPFFIQRMDIEQNAKFAIPKIFIKEN